MGVIDLKTVFRTQKCAEILLNNINFDHNEFLSNVYSCESEPPILAKLNHCG
jgi:hypothetical protein